MAGSQPEVGSHRGLPLLAALLVTLTAGLAPLGAEVVAVEVVERAPLLGGERFGEAGPYELLRGRIRFAFDPANPYNRRITDLTLAPRNPGGRVEASSNFLVLRPQDRGRTETAYLEVSNRGGKASLAYFNAASFSSSPRSRAELGDGFLLEQGLTLIWVGWQHDVEGDEHALASRLPVAGDGERPIEGWARSDWVVDRPTASLRLGHRTLAGYPASDPHHPGNVLTERDGRDAPRRVVPRSQWRFARHRGGSEVEDPEHLLLEGGFRAGKIYELVYRVADPPLVGLGLAIVRDTMSYAKYHPEAIFGGERGVGFGVSQTGRFLRHFLYQGFNTDEQRRAVFDGLLVHTAGAGRGSFNHRFAQPSRDAHRYSTFFYPTDLFPFTGRTQTDPVWGRTDGLFAHQHDPAHLPRIFYTNTGYEYWGRAASLIHTSVAGARDVEPLANERIYHLASAQHYVRGFPPPGVEPLPGSLVHPSNPLDFLVNLRALLVRLIDWVWERREPPASRYPRIDDGTLVPIEQLRFPSLPGVSSPTALHTAYRADYGPRWDDGIVDLQPPQLGPQWVPRVSRVDELGNELAGVRNVELRVPLATYTPWSRRRGVAGGEGELEDFVGYLIPLPRDEAERAATGDPRPSLATLYASRQAFAERVRAAAAELVGEGLLLERDIDRVVDRAERHWDWRLSLPPHPAPGR